MGNTKQGSGGCGTARTSVARSEWHLDDRRALRTRQARRESEPHWTCLLRSLNHALYPRFALTGSRPWARRPGGGRPSVESHEVCRFYPRSPRCGDTVQYRSRRPPLTGILAKPEHWFRLSHRLSGMYGPTPFCKRKMRMTEVVCGNQSMSIVVIESRVSLSLYADRRWWSSVFRGGVTLGVFS